MKIVNIFLFVFFFNLAHSQLLPKKVDISRFLQNQNPVWDTLTGYFYDGPFLGNGLMGMVLHRQDKDRDDHDINSLRFEINRSDLIDSCERQPEGYSHTRINVGRFALKLNANIKSTNFKINLHTAELTGSLVTDKENLKLRAYVHALKPLMVIEIESNLEDPLPTWYFVPDISGCIQDFGAVDYAESATYKRNKSPQIINKNGIYFYTQYLHQGKYFIVAWANVYVKNKKYLFATLYNSHPISAPQYDPEAFLNAEIKLPYDTIISNHKKWWSKFYDRNFVSLPDAKLESFYWIQQYKYGSAMRKSLQMCDLIGPWYVHTPWRGIWWNWNTQAMYYPLLTLNRNELVEPLVRTISKNISNLVNNVPDVYGQNSAGIGRASSYDLKSPIFYNDSLQLLAGQETGNLPWALHVCYLYYKYTLNDSLLLNTLHPLLQRSMNLYLNLLKLGDDKKLHLPYTMSPEYKTAEDCNYDMALLKWGLITLYEIEKKFNINIEEGKSKLEILSQLPDYAQNENGLAIGKNTYLNESHRHFSHLLAIYPLRTLDFDNPQSRKLAERSITHWLTVPGNGLTAWSYTSASSMYATLQNGNKAYQYLNYVFKSLTASTMYREAGPCLETPFSALSAINDMLLQSWDGVIRVFPAVPDAWRNLVFDNLKAEGAFLVSAKMVEKKTVFIKIKSLEGQRCFVENEMFGNKTIIVSGANATIKKVSTNKIELIINKNEEVLIYDSQYKNEIFINQVVAQTGKPNSFGKKKSKIL